jgi:hypothetical protein
MKNEKKLKLAAAMYEMNATYVIRVYIYPCIVSIYIIIIFILVLYHCIVSYNF